MTNPWRQQLGLRCCKGAGGPEVGWRTNWPGYVLFISTPSVAISGGPEDGASKTWSTRRANGLNLSNMSKRWSVRRARKGLIGGITWRHPAKKEGNLRAVLSCVSTKHQASPWKSPRLQETAAWLACNRIRSCFVHATHGEAAPTPAKADGIPAFPLA